VKTCSCGRRYTVAEWRALPCIGSTFYDDEIGRWFRLELRNCACRSTMALEFPAPVEFRGSEAECRILFGFVEAVRS
jgi:hypothetical protein